MNERLERHRMKMLAKIVMRKQGQSRINRAIRAHERVVANED